MINALFVYGTLAPHQENAHFLNALDGHWQTAFVKGEHFPQGLPGTEGYPALKLGSNSANIQGLIFTSAQLESIWPVLDAFEGEGYARVLTTAYLQDGRAYPAYIYAYNDPAYGR
ncbi:MAG: gamma-glutamylcyclotransferase family protein [Marinagarivorans sp.]|nr:gamma-glutamylcyclotransferase family protein [Marinagarivorans sp.]